MKEYLTIKEAAEYLGMGESTIRRYMTDKERTKIPFMCAVKGGGEKMAHNIYRFKRTALDRWMSGELTTDACGASGIT